MNPLLLVLLAYLFGATPTSYWVGRGVFGIDLRTRGSGNLGATNAFRVFGWKAALPVVVVDVLKGWLAVWLLPRLLATGASTTWAVAFGAAAVLGHCFSVWVRFRGGKGVATSGGVLIALAPLATAVGFVVWSVAVALTRYVSVGSLLAAVSVPLTVLVSSGTADPVLLGFTVALAAFVIWAHRSNIGRLLRGEENRFGGPFGGRSGGAGAPAASVSSVEGDAGASERPA